MSRATLFSLLVLPCAAWVCVGGSGCATTVKVVGRTTAAAVTATGTVAAATVRGTGKVALAAVDVSGDAAAAGLKQSAKLSKAGAVVLVDPRTGVVAELPWEKGLTWAVASQTAGLGEGAQVLRLIRAGKVVATSGKAARLVLAAGDVVEVEAPRAKARPARGKEAKAGPGLKKKGA